MAANICVRLYCFKQLLSLLISYACVNAGLPWRSEGSFGESFLTFHPEAGAPSFLLLFCKLQPRWPETFCVCFSPHHCRVGITDACHTIPGFYVGTRDGTQITRLGSKALYPMSHLAGPRLYSFSFRVVHFHCRLSPRQMPVKAVMAGLT